MKSNQNIARFVETLDNLSLSGQDVPGLILSRPGFGKTSTINMWCNLKGYNVFTLIPSRYASDDVIGLQSVDGGKLHRLSPSWFNKFCETAKNGKRNLLFIDEITTCDPFIQGPLLDLIFSHSLGEGYELPENTLIVAAGNYSSDLNNAFKISAPLINRFMILNLLSDDYSIEEMMDDSFESIKTKKNILSYLGVEEDKPVYSISKFKKWIKDSNEVNFGKCEITEDESYNGEEIGTLGFTSIRSLTYSMKFADSYFKRYSDDLWIRVIGDTLGLSSKREGKPMKYVLDSFKEEFLLVNDESTSIYEICNKFLNDYSSISNQDYAKLENLIKTTPTKNISDQDTSAFIEVVKVYGNTDKKIKKITDVFKSKLTASTKEYY